MLTGIFAHIWVIVELVNEQRPLTPQRFQLSLRLCVIALSGSCWTLRRYRRLKRCAIV